MLHLKSLKAFLTLSVLTTFMLNAESSGCVKCDEIRLYNAEHHENFEYYEDYLKGQKPEKRVDTVKSKT